MDHTLLIIIAVQIVGEALPISSSGHLQLASALFAQKLNVLPEHFDHFLHGPSIILIACFFWRAWSSLARRAAMSVWQVVRNGGWRALPYSNRCLLLLVGRICAMVCMADCVTAIFYGLIKGVGGKFLFLQGLPVLALGFCVTGVVLVSSWFDTFCYRKTLTTNGISLAPFTLSDLPSGKLYRRALILGAVQGLALLPGISRFATTVVAAQYLGMSPRRATQFSFLMFFPLMVAAFVFNGLPAVMGNLELFTVPVLATIVGATTLSFAAFALSYCLVLTQRLWWFGVYMLVPLGMTVWLMLG